ncbi:hypothetical protein [uncultured Oscillibacter sp.]|uniref:hypothetical protein n=1 Tax=uncultured Oscillibacter sp. TaxID=876091 RepID=UPI00280A5617|nr:hypothetical protein [uncultured Oscillibacter sp.]
MERGIFRCPPQWLPFLPPQVRCPSMQELPLSRWALLALTPDGARAIGGVQLRCKCLLLPGDCPVRTTAPFVISYGLSARDSLTLSGVRQPVLCIQRTLPGPGGALLEPQEIPLGELPGPPEALLGLLGLRLLLMPLTKALFLE